MSDRQFEYVNTPPKVLEFGAASYPEITYTVDWEQRRYPAPKDFDTLSDAEVSLLVMATDQPPHIDDKIQEVYDEIVKLRGLMMDERGIDDPEDRSELSMGDLTKLPEVIDRESVQVREVQDE